MIQVIAEITYACPCKCPFCIPPDSIVSGHYKAINQYVEGESCLGFTGRVLITRVFKRYYTGSLIKIRAYGVLPIKLTPEHPILVVRRRRLDAEDVNPKWVLADECLPKRSGKIGDYLVIPRIKGDVALDEISLEQFTNELGHSVAIGKNVPLSLPINEETAWLLGLYVAEGYSSVGKGATIYLGKHEKELVKKATKIIERLGYHPCVVEAPTELQLHIPSRILSRALPHWCGSNAKSKRIPWFILYHENDNILRSFLKGVADGDGAYIKRGEGYDLRIQIASKVLALQLQILAIRLGLPAYVREVKVKDRYIDGRRIRGGVHYVVSIPLFNRRRRYMVITSRFALTPIRQVYRIPYEGYVYNLETTDNTYLVHNVVVHNCTVPKTKNAKMPLEHYRKALALFKEFFNDNEPAVVISGGEPSIVENLKDYVVAAKELGYTVTVVTNGYNPVKVLEALPHVVEVSLDYFGEKHDSIRGVKGLFDRAMKLIHQAHFRIGISPVVRSTVMKDNIGDIIKVRKYLDNHMMEEIPVIAMPVRGAPHLAPTPKQLRQLEKHDIIISDNCPAGISSFVIDPDMNVLACIFYRKKLGELRKFTVDELKAIVEEGRKIPRFPCER